MRIARRFVIFFMILAMIGWGILLFLSALLYLLVYRNYDGVPDKTEDALFTSAWFCSAIAYACAWINRELNTRFLSVLIALLGIISFSIVWHLSRGPSMQDFPMMIAILGPPLIVAGGYTFLRVIREHPTR